MHERETKEALEDVVMCMTLCGGWVTSWSYSATTMGIVLTGSALCCPSYCLNGSLLSVANCRWDSCAKGAEGAG